MPAGGFDKRKNGLQADTLCSRSFRRSRFEAAGKEYGGVDPVNLAVGTNDGRGVGLSEAGAKIDLGGQAIAREIPNVEIAILTVDDGALVGGIDRGRIDAPFVNCVGMGYIAADSCQELDR